MPERPTFYILDAFSLIFQVFHAIPEMTGPAGQPTQAVFGIFRDLLNLLRDRKPDYLAAAFDGAGPVFRSEIFAEYKANRAAMPDDLVPQIPVIRRVFEGFRVPVLIEPGMEADDVIATLARRGEERGLDVFICTADKDARQLISDQIRIFNLRKKKVIDAPALEEDWGIRPDQVVDFLALTGDTVDNVPGVPGIGEDSPPRSSRSSARSTNLLANVDKVTGPKKQQNLREHAETARLAAQLVALRDDLPLDLDWDALQTTAARRQGPQGALHRVRLPPVPRRARRPATRDSRPRRPTWERRLPALVDTPEAFRDVPRRAGDGSPGSASTPRRPPLDPLRADLVGLSFSLEGRARRITCRSAGRSDRRLLDRGDDARGPPARS